MLALLLDESISHVIAEQTRNRRPEIAIQSVCHWRSGALMSHPDRLVLQAAFEEGLTLVTYDQKTIRPILSEWGYSGIDHAGVVFVDERTIRPDDFGGLVQAIEQMWLVEAEAEWLNRVYYLFLERP
jgi:hypothetical protein